MVTLDYRLSTEQKARLDSIDWASADATTLRYRAFVGDQILVIEGSDFSARWGWVPLLDFAAALTMITRRLEMGNTSDRFEFTESDAWLEFRRAGDRVSVSCNYADETASVPLSELAAAVEGHTRRILGDAVAAHPELAGNAGFKSWFPTSVS